MMKMPVLLPLFLFLVSCDPQDTPTPTGPTQTVPTTPSDDASPASGDQITKVELCSVEMLFNFTKQTVTFKNGNDQTARATVRRSVDDTVVVSNYLAPKGEDSEDATFAVGLQAKIMVEFLDPNLSLDQWKTCDEKVYLLGK